MMSLKAKRAHNDAIRKSLPPGSLFSGPRLDVVFEGWLLVGWNHGRAHYWRRGKGDDVHSSCGLARGFERDIRGNLMIFEAGNYPRCVKCAGKRLTEITQIGVAK